MLRIAGSLHTGTVRAHDLLRMLNRDGRNRCVDYDPGR
jgi:hypothetical protein